MKILYGAIDNQKIIVMSVKSSESELQDVERK